MANGRQLNANDTYLDRVKKLIPSEVSAGFLAINSLIPLDSNFNKYVFSFFIILIVFCILYLYRLELVKNILQIVFVSFFAFPVWALNIAIARIPWMDGQEFLAGCLLIMITLFIPLVVKP